MGHDIHFLERVTARANPEHQAIALALYRDPQLIKVLLRSYMPVIKGEVDRVALALDDGGQGPHIIVTSQGKFVTCLGEGMRLDETPVISRALLEESDAWRRAVRGGRDRDFYKIFDEILRQGRSPSRAEVELFECMGPLFMYFVSEEMYDSFEYWLGMEEKILELKHWGKGRPGRELMTLLRRWSDRRRVAGHCALWSAWAIRRAAPLQRATLEANHDRTMYLILGSLRSPMGILGAAWGLSCTEGARAEVMIANFKERLWERGIPGDQHLAIYPLALWMLACRRPEERAAIREQAMACLAWLRDDPLCGEHVVYLGDGLRQTVRAIDERHDQLPLVERLGRYHVERLPAWLRPSCDPAQVGLDPEGATLRLLSLDHHILAPALPNARCLWAYAPELASRTSAQLYPIEPVRWTPTQRGLMDMELVQDVIAYERQRSAKTTRATSKQGRNEPCACGSGKKHKQCCGQNADA